MVLIGCLSSSRDPFSYQDLFDVSSEVYYPEESRSCSVCWRTKAEAAGPPSSHWLGSETMQKAAENTSRKYVSKNGKLNSLQNAAYVIIHLLFEHAWASLQILSRTKHICMLSCSTSWSRRKGARARRMYQSLFVWEEPWNVFKLFPCDDQR